MNNSDVAWYDANANEYYERSSVHYHPKLQENFVKLLPANAKILDHGCGFGRDSKLFEDMGFDVTGVDLSSELLKIAAKTSPESLFLTCDISKALPFVDASFLGIWCMTTLIHLKSLKAMEKTLKEIYRVMKEGGVVHILTGYKFNDVRVFTTDTSPKRSFLRVTEKELNKICSKIGFNTLICKVAPETEITNDGRPEISWVYYLGKK